MSFFTYTSKLFALKPRVVIDDHTFYARTSLVSQFLTFFSYSKKFEADRRTSMIELTRKIFWLSRSSKTIPFSRVSHVDTEYRSIGTGWGWTNDGFGRHDSIEKFTASLVLINPDERLKLFSFIGEGSAETGAVGVLFGGDSWIDYRGDQEESARGFEKALAGFLNIPVGHPKTSPKLNEVKIQYYCKSCQRPANPTQPKCIYCGSTEKGVTKT